MDRRNFIAALAGTAFGQSVNRTAALPRPATLDLRDPMRLASECVLNRMDPDRSYRPWFAVEVAKHRPTLQRHAVWDFGDKGGRFLEGLILTLEISPATQDMP